MSSKFTSYVFILCYFIASSFLFGQKQIHVLTIVDTDMQAADLTFPTELRDGAMYVRSHIAAEAKFLAYNLNLTEQDIHFYEVSGKAGEGMNNFTPDGVFAQLDTMSTKVQQGDIVLVGTYSHGVRGINNSSDAPQLLIDKLDTPNPNFIFYNDILKHLLGLKPSFCLSIVNSCQEERNSNIATLSYRPQQQRVWVAATSRNRKNSQYQYDLLFNKPLTTPYPTVFVELYSCSKKQYSYVDSEGGIFAKTFFEVFAQKLSGGGQRYIDWQTIGSEVQREVAQNTVNMEAGVQVPVGTIKCYDENKNMVRKLDITKRNLAVKPVRDTVLENFMKSDIMKGRKNPDLALLRRFTKLANTYMLYGAREQAIKTVDTTIYFLKKRVKADSIKGRKPNSATITDVGDAMYYLATCYELKANLLDYEANPDESRIFLEKAKVLYSKLHAESSKEVIDKILEKFDKPEDRP